MNARGEIGKPKVRVVFLDTEQFEANALNFGHTNFERLRNLVKEGFVKVLLTEVVVREVRRHIHKSFKDARKKLGQQFGGLFQNLDRSPMPPPLNDEYWANAEQEVAKQFDSFCKNMDAEVIPVKPELVNVVFDWYFANDAPFDTSRRKAEFLDAFSIACINEWAETQADSVYAVSKDEAFRITSREVKRSSKLERLDNLNAFFELFPNPEIASAIKNAFKDFLEDDDNSTFGEDVFRELGFYVEDEDESSTRNVDSVFVICSESDRMHVVEAKDGKAVLAGKMYVHFQADISDLRELVDERTFVSAEITLTYDEQKPSVINVESVNYDQGYGIGVSLPSMHRHRG